MKTWNENHKWMPLWAVRWVAVDGQWRTAKVREMTASAAAERLGRVPQVQGIDSRIEKLEDGQSS